MDEADAEDQQVHRLHRLPRGADRRLRLRGLRRLRHRRLRVQLGRAGHARHLRHRYRRQLPALRPHLRRGGLRRAPDRGRPPRGKLPHVRGVHPEVRVHSRGEPPVPSPRLLGLHEAPRQPRRERGGLLRGRRLPPAVHELDPRRVALRGVGRLRGAGGERRAVHLQQRLRHVRHQAERQRALDAAHLRGHLPRVVPPCRHGGAALVSQGRQGRGHPRAALARDLPPPPRGGRRRPVAPRQFRAPHRAIARGRRRALGIHHALGVEARRRVDTSGGGCRGSRLHHPQGRPDRARVRRAPAAGRLGRRRWMGGDVGRPRRLGVPIGVDGHRHRLLRSLALARAACRHAQTEGLARDPPGCRSDVQ
mmetsp:Transcript_128920/g.360711  ORF Transcript_128920/g.360711 Transcript_128920/m.360711 type:complete len:364 (+) Transcript_128920:1196-2287(+)